MRFWSALLFSFSCFLAYHCQHRLIFEIFPSRGSEGCSFGLVLIERPISVVVMTLCLFGLEMFSFSWRSVHRPSYRFLRMTLLILSLFQLSLIV